MVGQACGASASDQAARDRTDDCRHGQREPGLSLYLDASALVKLLIEEFGSDELAQEITRHSLLASAEISYVECCAALARAHREARITMRERDLSVDHLNEVWAGLKRVEVTDELVGQAARLALEVSLRGYDAVQLAAALSLAELGNVVVASWDNELRAAARGKGLAAFPH